MAQSLQTHEIKSKTRGCVEVQGSFAPAGTGAVTTVNGTGFTVARTDVGEFTITLNESYNELVACTAGLMLATPGDQVLQFGAFSSANKTLVLNVWDISGGALADIAADADNRIHFRLTLKRTQF